MKNTLKVIVSLCFVLTFMIIGVGCSTQNKDLEQKVSNLETQISTLNSQIAELESQASSLNSQIAELNQNIDSTTPFIFMDENTTKTISIKNGCEFVVLFNSDSCYTYFDADHIASIDVQKYHQEDKEFKYYDEPFNLPTRYKTFGSGLYKFKVSNCFATTLTIDFTTTERH